MAHTAGEDVAHDWLFGPFRLHRAERRLLEHDRVVRLGGRAMDLLIALVERAGDVLGRDELTARIWPTTCVEESSLRVHVSALRKALGDGHGGQRYIVNTSGRGYQFVAPVQVVVAPLATPDTPETPATQRHNLPGPLTRAIGRDPVLVALAGVLGSRRLLTISGPGGIGKTTVALALAETMLPHYRDGIAFVAIEPITDTATLPLAVGSVLGLALPRQDTLAPLTAFLQHREMLLVLDNCEHLIDAAATLAEQLLACGEGIHVLATSREPLNVAGEQVHRLAALVSPPAHLSPTAAEALAFPAVQLFVERAIGSNDTFALSDTDAPALADLCRRLDGIPLAIEFAAARVAELGLTGLADGLDDRLAWSHHGPHGTRPRHHTITALIDWSYDLLQPAERLVLQRLSVFRAGFTLEAACAVASDTDLAAAGVVDAVLGLVAKSLVSVDARHDRVHYHLLESTRDYATRKLAAQGDTDSTRLRHATHLRDFLADAESERGTLRRQDWLARYRDVIDDLRAAMAWCFASPATRLLGIELTVAGLRPVHQLGLVDQHHPWVERAMAHVAELSPPQPELELRLIAGKTTFGSQGTISGNPAELLDRAAVLADALDDPVSRIAAVRDYWGNAFGSGNYPLAASTCEQMATLARDVPEARLLVDRTRAMTLHYLGDHVAATAFITRVLASPQPAGPLYQIPLTPLGVSMRIVLARSLWLQGRADQARAVTQEALALAEEAGPYALAQVLGSAACPIAFWCGDHDRARVHTAQLREQSIRQASPYWLAWADHYARVLDGTPAAARPAGVKALDVMVTIDSQFLTPALVARSTRGDVGWSTPEVFRRAGEACLAHDPAAALGWFERSLDVARQQGALAWTLRTTTSLARLWHGGPRAAEGHDRLADVRARFTEGFDTADLRAAGLAG